MKRQKKIFKSITAMALTAALVLGVIPLPGMLGGHAGISDIQAATFDDINQEAVFQKQAVGSSTCTLVSAAMLLRRTALMRGDSDWNTISEDTIKSVAWSGGLRWSFTYSGMKVSHATFTSGNATAELIELLKKHPEGIVVYDRGIPHAVLVTDYTDGVFYCADPTASRPNGRIKISQSSVAIANCDDYWYVTSPSVSLEVQPTSVSLDATELIFMNNGMRTLTATVAPLDAANKNVVWSSSDTAVATVSASGMVTAVGHGIATITATTESGSKTATCTVTVIMDGLNKSVTDDNLYYYKDGVVDTTFTGMVSNDDGTWYVKNGAVDTSFTSLICDKNITWWYIRNGKVAADYTGLVTYNGSQWYIRNGVLNRANGIVLIDGEWYYMVNGKYTPTYTGLVTYNGAKWYVKNGMLNRANGIVLIDGEWYYMVNGKYTPTYTGLVTYNGSKWYVKNGMLNRVTGLEYVNNGWSYFTKGKYDSSYKGLVSKNGDLWFVTNGTINRVNGMWAQNGDIYVISGGKVDKTVNTLKYHQGNWYYFKAGKTDRTYTGLVKYNNRMWYVESGCLDKTYTGTVEHDGVIYQVANGVGTIKK